VTQQALMQVLVEKGMVSTVMNKTSMKLINAVPEPFHWE
jgi:hypothetical protein